LSETPKGTDLNFNIGSSGERRFYQCEISMRTLFVSFVVVASLSGFASASFADQIGNPNGTNKALLNQQPPNRPPPEPPKPPPKKPPQQQPKKN
jgi:hypothetical protein